MILFVKRIVWENMNDKQEELCATVNGAMILLNHKIIDQSAAQVASFVFQKMCLFCS